MQEDCKEFIVSLGHIVRPSVNCSFKQQQQPLPKTLQSTSGSGYAGFYLYIRKHYL